MKIKKRIMGHDIILEHRVVKVYPNRFTLYDVYKGNQFLYRICFTDLELVHIKENGYMISDEEVFS